MKIVVLDGYTENPGDISWAPLEALGDVTVYDRTAYEESPLIAERIGDAEIAVTNKTPISRQTIDRCPNLKGIAVLATGYNVIDYDYAGEKGIPVMNVPVYGTDNVSQYAIALLLEACSRVGHHDASVHAGDWAGNTDWCYWHYPLIEVSGKTAGIIGLGRIGMNTAKILKAMNVNVIAYSRSRSEAGEAVAKYVELDELLAKSDFIFLHCPLFPDTKGMINKDNIAKMKDGVIIINNSRGPLVVEEDLFEALESGKVAAAALDVVSTEPIRPDNILLKAKNCIITPHISWATREARERIMNTTAENIRSVIEGKPVHVVNDKA
ncbi:MAG: D-2-hydroxyacid dehydrogenase [Clostridiales bacterium]|nr:D-2-hydroxyacid dehydrogenase [Clostridiales bacterium]